MGPGDGREDEPVAGGRWRGPPERGRARRQRAGRYRGPAAHDGGKKNSWWREPTDEERRIVALARIESRLKAEEAAYAATLFEFRDRELEELRQAIIKGTVALSQLTTSRGSGTFIHGKELRSRLIRILAEVRNFGIQQVSEELGRQEAVKAS